MTNSLREAIAVVRQLADEEQDEAAEALFAYLSNNDQRQTASLSPHE